MDHSDDRTLLVQKRATDIRRKASGSRPKKDAGDRILLHERRPRIRQRPHGLDEIRALGQCYDEAITAATYRFRHTTACRAGYVFDEP